MDVSGGLRGENWLVDGKECSKLVGGVYWFVEGIIAEGWGLVGCME